MYLILKYKENKVKEQQFKLFMSQVAAPSMKTSEKAKKVNKPTSTLVHMYIHKHVPMYICVLSFAMQRMPEHTGRMAVGDIVLSKQIAQV